jgi:cholesterol transport system auxiliary component
MRTIPNAIQSRTGAAGRDSALRRFLAVAAIAALGVLLGSCALGPQSREQPATYDLGLPHNPPAAPRVMDFVLMIPDVAAPPWIDHPGIVYRLGYLDAARPRAYAQSRWTASPAQLLAQRVRARFAAATLGVVGGHEGTRAEYALRIELEDFSQSFEAADRSRVGVRARATLVDLSRHALRAQRTFSVERGAAPDAAGAVRAFGEASDALIEQLVEWTAASLKEVRAGQDAASRQRRSR